MRLTKLRPPRRFYHRRWVKWAALIAIVAAVWLVYSREGSSFIDRAIGPRRQTPRTGLIVSSSQPVTYTLEQTNSLIKQTQGQTAAAARYAVSKRSISYTSEDTNENRLTIGARVYLPQSPRGAVPVLAFAPGTTGIGDQCAPSLEQPAKANWSNYDSHMAAYAAQGFAVVITDYEGLGDLNRLHHYMVGELEGRAVLDSARAVYNLPAAKGLVNKSQLFLAGYSQGGHAVFWADRLAADYAPELRIRGVVGFGPVMDVTKTWRDITIGANINWFGPYVLTSYQDYYGEPYDLENILLPQWRTNLAADVAAHCIDSVINFWGRKPDAIYGGNFLQALRNNNLAEAGFADLADDLSENQIGEQPTRSAKLINQGSLDNVVLPGQQVEALSRLCRRARGAVGLTTYPRANHYNTMTQSFNDTLSWMKQVMAGQPVKNDCRGG